MFPIFAAWPWPFFQLQALEFGPALAAIAILAAAQMYVRRTHTTHAMRQHVRDLAARGKAVRVTDFHQTPLADEVAGRNYDLPGLITEDWLVENTPAAVADYYIFGPRPVLRGAVSALSPAGVPSSRIHYEFFGPADEILAA